jgi:hypothetical protein
MTSSSSGHQQVKPDPVDDAIAGPTELRNEVDRILALWDQAFLAKC